VQIELEGRDVFLFPLLLVEVVTQAFVEGVGVLVVGETEVVPVGVHLLSLLLDLHCTLVIVVGLLGRDVLGGGGLRGDEVGFAFGREVRLRLLQRELEFVAVFDDILF